jgi:hypothetical protein
MGFAMILKFSKRGMVMMKFRLCRLEFGVSSMEDIRFLYRTWDSLWTLEDRGNTDSILVYVTVDDRLPGEEVSLDFHGTTEVLDKFLGILKQAGLKFSCSDLVPGLIKMCHVDHDQGDLGAIGAHGGHKPNKRQDG